MFFLNEHHLVDNESVSKTYESWGVDSPADNDSSSDAMCFHTSCL